MGTVRKGQQSWDSRENVISGCFVLFVFFLFHSLPKLSRASGRLEWGDPYEQVSPLSVSQQDSRSLVANSSHRAWISSSGREWPFLLRLDLDEPLGVTSAGGESLMSEDLRGSSWVLCLCVSCV